MKKTTRFATLLVGVHILLLVSRPATAAEGRNISEQVTFLYYSDIEEAGQFYESVMGFEPTFELYWVKIYKTNQGAAVGLVDETKGSLKSSGDKPVMLSWVTDDVDGWYEYLKGKGVKMLSEPGNTEETGIRSFLFQDPGGYTLEFFEWTR
jgi:predicted enzyme related to lactoylglutathione lyase